MDQVRKKSNNGRCAGTLYNVLVLLAVLFLFAPGQPLFGEPRTVKVGAISMEATHRFETPLAKKIEDVMPLIAEGAQQGVDIVVLPESYFRGKSLASDNQELSASVVLDSMKAGARRGAIYVAFQVAEREGSNLYNTVVLVDRKGEYVGKYRKVNLPPEEQAMTPGDAFRVFDTDFGKIGFLICWDFWFTNPAKALVDMGAEMIIIPTWCNIERNLQTNAAEEGVPMAFSILRVNCGAGKENLSSSVYDHHGDAVYLDHFVGANKIAIGTVTLGDYKNLALNKSVKTSTATDPGHPGAHAVDGRYSTERDAPASSQTYWKASSLPQWLEIDLGDEFAVDRVSIAQFNTDGFEYKLEGRSQEGGYELISDQFDKKETFLEHGVAGSEILTSRFDDDCRVPTKKYRYVKLTVNSTTESDVLINEVKVFGYLEPQTKVGLDNIESPKQFQVFQNYPNPFNPTTNIQFEIPEPSKVKLEVFSITGQKVVTLADHHYDMGTYTIAWDGKYMNNQQVVSGVYFYRLTTENRVFTNEMLFLR